MAVLFRTHASTATGLGHLMRCLALAQTLDANHCEVVFALKAEAKSLALGRHDWVGRIIVLPDELDEQQELDYLQHLPEWPQFSAVVLDGYGFSERYRTDLQRMAPLVAIFDDANLDMALHADVIINGSDGADTGYYHTYASQARLCLGRAYRVLRREFEVLPEIPFVRRHTLTLMLGGSDVLNLTLPLLQALETQGADMPIRVITGAAYGHLAALQDWLSQTQLTIQHIHDCQQMADMMIHSRLAVTAAGGTQFELLACATPAILLVVADNQRAATAAASQQGWCVSQDVVAGANPAELAARVLALWQNDKQLAVMHQHAAALADRQGAQRVVECLFEQMEQQRCS